MSIASTAWMTGTGPYGTSTDKRDVSKLLATIMLKDTAFINEIKYGGVIHNIKGEWLEDALNACFFYGRSTISTEIEIATNQSAVAGIVRANTLVSPEGNSWVAKFTSTGVAGATSAVTSYGMGSALVSQYEVCAASTKFYIVGQPFKDRSDASDDISKARSVKTNYAQVFETAIEIEKSREGIDMYAVSNELSLQTTNRTYELKRQMNLAFIYGKPLYSGGYTGDNQLRTTAGFCHFLRDPDMDGYYEDTMVTNVAGALTKTAINQLLDDIYQAGGLDDKSNCCIFTGPKQARALSALEVSSIRRGPRDRVVGEFMDKFKSDLGFDLDVKVERNWPNDKLAVVDRNRVEYCALKGDTLSLEKMAKTGRSQKFQLSGQYLLKVMNADAAHGLLRGLT